MRKAPRARVDAVLAGDVGGTRARFALVEVKSKKILHEAVLSSQEHPSFDSALRRFLSEAPRGPRIRAASFGIAGPIVHQRVRTTNLPWRIDARAVARDLNLPNVTLLNDLVAVGLGAMATHKLSVIHRGRPKRTGANLAAIAAGTGLGEAAFVWDGSKHVPCATEGSHVDFAPRTPIEGELRDKLAIEFGHVSYERVASGSTINAIYNLFDQRIGESKDNAARVATASDPNVAVVELALEGSSEAAMCAIDLWASVYGAEAGNLALKCLATGGVYVCGGVSARLAKVLAAGLPSRRRAGGQRAPSPFVEAFLDKGRMRPLLENIPVAVVTEPLAGLRGAAVHAIQAAVSSR
ncbi:MAG: glucokinase [Polyangiaceae bacterium]|nr:glucokinase [Polyangiaceae bacterium]